VGRVRVWEVWLGAVASRGAGRVTCLRSQRTAYWRQPAFCPTSRCVLGPQPQNRRDRSGRGPKTRETDVPNTM